MDARCAIDRCRAEAVLDYLGRGICETHWNEMSAEDAPLDALRMVLGIEATAPAALEDTMATKKTKTTKATKARTKGATAAKKPNAERDEPVEGLVVFAFRLTQAERDAIHKTAGPARASRYVRRVAAAFAAEDESAFRSVLKEAREARS